LPINYVPLFFKNVTISQNIGLNVAYWNFHEREITFENGKYRVNNKTDLIFFHFSNFKPKNKNVISPYFTRFQMDDNKTIKTLFENYCDSLILNNYEYISKIPYFYTQEREVFQSKKRKERIAKEPLSKRIMYKVKDYMPKSINRYIKKYSDLD
jgi:hypothetical protein